MARNYTSTPSPPTVRPPQPGTSPPWWRRTWALIVGAIVLLVIGITIGNTSASTNTAATETETETETITVAGTPDDAALHEAETDLESAQDDLAATQGKLRDKRAELRRVRRQIAAAKTIVTKSTIAGDGTYEVDTDIEPGVYRADASPGCYWARLNSLDTSDIIDNDNADGPVVLEVLPSDRALLVSGCADLRRAG